MNLFHIAFGIIRNATINRWQVITSLKGVFSLPNIRNKFAFFIPLSTRFTTAFSISIAFFYTGDVNA
ncbi:hypothetical protein EYS14_11740 [Alteromonadaceae bacterium M269]|nr:hypothetical protein EYS14_11740 [Alteromonadaceae bacterium M269]